MRKTIRERFESKYQKSNTGCFVWIGMMQNNGYGRFTLTNRKYQLLMFITL